MDVSALVTIVQTVGFPIAMCGLMAWYVKYMGDKNRETLDGQNARHEREMNVVSEALNNNTSALYAVEKTLAVLCGHILKDTTFNTGGKEDG